MRVGLGVCAVRARGGHVWKEGVDAMRVGEGFRAGKIDVVLRITNQLIV